MLLSNARIEKSEKITFYEQDMLIDDNLYSGNIQVTLNVDYINSGIGIALISDECLYLNSAGEIYLLRVGHGECSLIKRIANKMDIIETASLVNVQPFMENMKIELRKINNRVYLYINDKLAIKKYLPTDLNTFAIGYYSSAGNIINSISIASAIPNGWVVNMDNTNGGYIEFAKDKFTISNCSDKAEVEQINITLKANENQDKKYYLTFKKEGELNDIVPYVFKSDDDRYVDKDKNILEKDNSFIVKSEGNYNIKFTGTVGTISEIQISEREDDFYVGTDYDTVTSAGSYIKIKTSELSKIEWSGIIKNVPNDKYGEDINKYGVVKDFKKYHTPEELNIKLNDLYDYQIELNSSNILNIINGKNKTSKKLTIQDSVVIFENIDAIITKLVLYKKDGTKVDIFDQDIKKQFIPASIKSPIVVTTDSGEPLDLSASYRIVDDGDKLKYVFTNVEREVFEPTNRIRMENPMSPNMDTIVVYGILKDSNTYPENLMKDDKKGIGSYCDNYETLHEASLQRVDKDTGLIVVTDKDDNYMKNRYKELVVDYLKNNSYAINYRHDLGSYEIDISTENNTKVYYDAINEDNAELVNINDYKLLNIPIKNNSYIVLKGR